MGLGLLALFAAGSMAHAAVVYRWTDADGVVHYSDQPVPGAEKIETLTGGRMGTVAPDAGAAAASGEHPKGAGPELGRFMIDSPSNEQTFTANEPVNVHLSLDPALQPTQAITWYLNGSPLADRAPDAVQFTLEDLPRGAYTLSATVVDQATGESKSAETITFYVQRTTLYSPQRKSSP